VDDAGLFCVLQEPSKGRDAIAVDYIHAKDRVDIATTRHHKPIAKEGGEKTEIGIYQHQR
jgi:hypothetical protein